MNFWLKFMKAKHAGTGYRMSKDSSTEIGSQMYVDDSNWATRTGQDLSDVVASNCTFVDFHGLAFNRKKCEYLVINQRLPAGPGAWERPHWPGGQTIYEKIRIVPTIDKKRRDEKETDLRAKERATMASVRDPISKQIVQQVGQDVWLSLQDAMSEATSGWEEALIKSREEGSQAPSHTPVSASISAFRGKGQWWATTTDKDLEEDSALLAQEWSVLTASRADLRVPERTAMRYLGVWFEGDGQWGIQRGILARKFATLVDKITRSSPTREQAIYCINATINTALKFPLQVAQVPATTLKAWDRTNRTVVKRRATCQERRPRT